MNRSIFHGRINNLCEGLTKRIIICYGPWVEVTERTNSVVLSEFICLSYYACNAKFPLDVLARKVF